MNKIKQVPVVVLNGFLGAGKTTLFRNLLSQANRKNINVCAIVNDMSELDVDGELLEETAIVEENTGILESISSCVLSSKEGLLKLDDSIQRLLKYQDPEIIIIETSGSCHPLPLVEYFKEQTKFKLSGIFVLVDSLMLAHDFSFGKNLIPVIQQNKFNDKRDMVNLFVEQILFSSHLFITKKDKIAEEKLPEVASYISQINPYISIHSLVFGKLNIESLLDLKAYDYIRVSELVRQLKLEVNFTNTNQPHDIDSRVIKDERPFHPKRLWDACHQYLGQKIYRSKGFFWLASRNKDSLLWQQASGGISLEFIGTWRSGVLEDENHGLTEIEVEHMKQIITKNHGRFGDRHCHLTVIGDPTQVDLFTDKLKSCFLTEDEVLLWETGFQFDDPWPKNIIRHVN